MSSSETGRREPRGGRRVFRALALVFVFLGAGPVLDGAVSPGARAAHAKHEIKIATLAPDGTTWMKLMRELDQAIRQETGNDVGLRFYPGGIQGDEPVVLRKIRTGQLQGGGFTGVGLGEIAPALRVMELPFLFRNDDEVLDVLEKMDPVFERELQDGGFTLLGWADVGFVYLYSKEPIRTAEDLKSRKVWLWEGDPLAKAFLEAAGISPVPLSVTDVMTSLQTGLVSAVYVSPMACIALQWFTRVAYTTSVPIAYAIGAVVVTNQAWGEISAEDQKTVRRLCDKYFGMLRTATIEENTKSIDVIAKSGVKTVTPSAEETQAFRSIGARVAENLVGVLYPPQILQQVQSELDAYRAAHPEGQGGGVE